MSKINELTSEQLEKMTAVKDFWLDYLFSCKNTLNKEAAEAGITWLYKLINKEKPIILYVDSPMACQYAVSYLKYFLKDEAFTQIRDEVRDKVWAKVRDEVWDKVEDKVEAKVRAKVEDEVWDKVRDKVELRIRNQICDQDPIENKYEIFSTYGNIGDYGWVSFCDFFHEIGIVNHADFNQFKNLLLAGVYDMIQLEGFCIVSSLPDAIKRNQHNRLHCEDGPAIHFRDGYEQYYWNGVSVPKEWIMQPHTITRQTILTEENAERRRCIREIIGTKKYAELLYVKEIDKDHVNGQDVVLYKTKEPDNIINKHIYFVNVTCHSTQREYFLCVPEEAATNAWSAVAWTFQMNEQTYKPLIET